MQDVIDRIPPRLRRHGAALALAVASLIALVADYPLLALPLAASALGITIFKRGQRKKAAAAEQERRKLRRDSSTARDADLGAQAATGAADFYSGRGLPLGRHIQPDGTIGQPIIAAGDASAMVVGPPGSGKTTRVLTPGVLTTRGPVLTTSVKSDLAQMTTAARSLVGRVCVVDPAGVSTAVAQTTNPHQHGKSRAARAQAVAACRTAWSPLQSARTAGEAEVTAHLLVHAGAEVVQEGGGGTKFWDASAESLLTVLLWLAARVPGSTMRTVGDLLAAVQRVADTTPAPELDNLFGESPEPTPTAPSSLDLPGTPAELVSLVRDHAGGGWRTVSALLQGLAERYAAASDQANHGTRFDSAMWDVAAMQGMFDTIAGVATAAGETAAGIVGNLHTVLKPLLASPAIADVAWDDPDVLDLRVWAASQADTLHLVAPIKAARYRGFFSALVTAAVTEILDHAGTLPGQTLPSRALIVLDELASVCSLPDLTEWLSTARSFGVRLALGVQSPAQIRRRYTPDGWHEIMSSCSGGIIVLPGLSDVPALRDFQALGGQRNLIEVTKSTATTKGTSKSSGESRGSSESKSTTETETETIQRTDLASPAAIREQPRDQCFIFAGATPPLQAQTAGVWEDKILEPLAYGSGERLKQAAQRLQQLQRQAPPAQ